MRRSYFGTALCPACARAEAAVLDELGTWPRPWWDVPASSSVAVIGERGVVAGNGTGGVRVSRGLPKSLAHLATGAELYGWRSVWVHESALSALGWPHELPRHDEPGHGQPVPHPFVDDAGELTTSRQPAGLSAHAYFYERGGWGFDLHVPGWLASSPFAGTDDADELLHVVSAFEAATGGCSWKGTGAVTSDAWLRAAHKRGTPLVATTLPPVATYAREEPLHWSRELTDADRAAKWCHGFDTNFAYASAASSLALPAGEPEHRQSPDFNERLPGVWAFEAPAWPRPDVPCPWGDAGAGELVWVTTPTMHRARQVAHELGAGVEPVEAWTWPSSHTYLAGWYRMLRDGRAKLSAPDGPAGPALAALKAVASSGVGRLGAERRTQGTADVLYQPYWRWAVIAEARARLQRKVAALDGAVVAVFVDAIYVLSRYRQPALAAQHLGLELSPGLGGWKSEGTIPAGVAFDALGAGAADIGAGELHRAFGG